VTSMHAMDRSAALYNAQPATGALTQQRMGQTLAEMLKMYASITAIVMYTSMIYNADCRIYL